MFNAQNCKKRRNGDRPSISLANFTTTSCLDVNDPSWINLTSHIQTNLQQIDPNNIFLSDENILSLPGLQTNLQHLDDVFSGYDVRVIVTYRRYYDWITSIYNQNSKFNTVNVTVPGEGGPTQPQKFIVPFPTFYQKHFIPHPPSSVLTKFTIDMI